MKEISDEIYEKLDVLGLLPTPVNSKNVGGSNYARHLLQPWAIWEDWNLNPWDADIVKRVLRTKDGDSRKMDYEKIIHICQERIRQIDVMDKYTKNTKAIPEQNNNEIKEQDVFLCTKNWCVDDGDRMTIFFEENHCYESHCNGHITGNHGISISVNETQLKEHFKRINEE